MQRLRTIERGRPIWGNGRWLGVPEAQDRLGEVMGDSQGPKDRGLPLTCGVALSKAQIGTPSSEQGAAVGTVTHLDGFHDGFVQIREAREPEHHAVDQLRQLLQAAGPRVGVLLDQRGHHWGDVREEL